MAPFEQQRPCIHVSLFAGVEDSLYHWVQIGSEEEGVPCRRVDETADDLVALAFAAAQSSRFNIGVGLSNSAVVLHETHMPPEQPVLSFKFADRGEYICRLMGSNAARMIIRKPFRFDDQTIPFNKGSASQAMINIEAVPDLDIGPANSVTDPAQIAEIVTMIVQKLQERGIR